MKPFFKKVLLLALLATVGISFTPRTASADTIGYLLNTFNLDMGTYPPPYALVIVNTPSPDSATANILFLSNSPDGYWFGDGGSVAVNTNGAATVSNIAAAGCRDGSCATFVVGGAGNEDGFGSFNTTLNATGSGEGGWQGVASQISFTLTKTIGTWASAATVLTLNDSPGSTDYLAAAHIFVGAANASDATATGYAATPGLTTDQTCFNCPSVPDGGMTISLLGMAMAGLGFVARRKI